jgi:heat shock protein HtpX
MERRDFRREMARNTRDSVLLAAAVSVVLFLLIVSIGWIFDPEATYFIVPAAVVFVFAYTWGSYSYGDQVVLSSVGAYPAEGSQFTYLRNAVEGVSIAAGVPAPKVYVIPSRELNAFATGNDPKTASVAVTEGLIENLNRAELEGVVAHEVSHIKNKDIQFMTLVAVLVGLVSIISHIILRSMRFSGGRSRRGRDREGGAGILLLVGLVLAIIAPIAVRLVQFAVSRRREFLADASGAELTRYPDGLASALEKIGRLNTGKMEVDEAVSHLFFADPVHSALDSLYSTHPPIAERVKRLREM